MEDKSWILYGKDVQLLQNWVVENGVLFAEFALAAVGIALTLFFARKTNTNLRSMRGIEETLAAKVERIGDRSDEMAESLDAMRKLEKDLNERVLSVDKKVLTVADSTRRLRTGVPEVIESIREFLRGVDPDDSLYVMTDTAAIGAIHCKNSEAVKAYRVLGRELSEDLIEIQVLMYNCAMRTARFFFTTLRSSQNVESGALMEKFAHPVLRALGESVEDNREFLSQHLQDHNIRIQELQRARRTKMGSEYVDPYRDVGDLPLQLFIRDGRDINRRRALVIFAGTYNMEKIEEVRAMNTKDPKLVETFISMYETISGLDTQAD